MIFDGARDHDLLLDTNTSRSFWSLWGPLLPIATAAGMIVGTALALLGG